MVQDGAFSRQAVWNNEAGSHSSVKPHNNCRCMESSLLIPCTCMVSSTPPGRWRWPFFKFYFIYLFIYFWLCWVFISLRGLSLAAASGGHSSSRCAGLSLSRPLLLRSTGSRHAGSVVVAHGLSCSAACGIFPDQGSNPCPLHWQADSQPLHHQGSPGDDLWSGTEFATPKCLSGMWIISSWNQSRPKRLRKKHWPSPNCLKNFGRGPITGRELLP